MAKKIVPETLLEVRRRLIREISNGEDCRPDWATYVKEQFARCSDDPHAEPPGPLQSRAQTRLRLAYVNTNPPRHQQPEPDYVVRCRAFDELVKSGAWWNDHEAVAKAFADRNARKAAIEDQERPKLALAWSRE